MSKVNLVNAYFDGDLSEAQIHDFKNQLNSDAELKNEFDFQSDVVEGLKEARRVELKTMLNNVTVGGAATGAGGWSLGKIAASLLLLGVAGAGTVWYFSQNNESPKNEAVSPLTILEEPEETEQVIESESVEAPAEIAQNEAPEEGVTAMEAKEDTEEVVKVEEVQAIAEPMEAAKEEVVITQPDIRKPDVITSFENEDEDSDDMASPESGLGSKEKNNMPTIDVDVDNTKKKYTFHYQLKDGRLILYGAFDKGLYEILEFNTTSGKNVFLYYKEEYFALSENKEKVTPLVAVKDKDLIQKLMKARGES